MYYVIIDPSFWFLQVCLMHSSPDSKSHLLHDPPVSLQGSLGRRARCMVLQLGCCFEALSEQCHRVPHD